MNFKKEFATVDISVETLQVTKKIRLINLITKKTINLIFKTLSTPYFKRIKRKSPKNGTKILHSKPFFFARNDKWKIWS